MLKNYIDDTDAHLSLAAYLSYKMGKSMSVLMYALGFIEKMVSKSNIVIIGEK